MLLSLGEFAVVFEVENKMSLRQKIFESPNAVALGVPATTYSFDAGVPLDALLFAQTGVPTAPDGTTWQLNGCVPIMPFAPTLDNANYQDAATTDVNPATFMFTRRGAATVTGTFGGMSAPPDTVHVCAPTPDDMPVVDTNDPRIATMGSALWLMCGTPALDGISIYFSATSTDGSTGALAAIQLVKTTRTTRKSDGTTSTLTTNGAFVLDDGVLHTVLFKNRRVPVGSPLLIADSPAQQLGDQLSEVWIDEHFTTYLMFCSDKSTNARWAALQILQWYWTAHARRTGRGAWTLESGETRAYDATLAPTNPSWKSRIASYGYQPPLGPGFSEDLMVPISLTRAR
jgi:hypothetical protein